MPTAEKTKPIIRKRGNKNFKRFQSDRFKRIARSSWRRPHGIDGAFRRQYRGRGKMVKIGFGTDKAVRGIDKNSGFRRMRVANAAQLEALVMHKNKYSVDIAHQVGGRLRAKLIQRAKELDIRVNNVGSKIVSEEHE
mmetsp:Transcript_2314/g.3352  ORF Transcript_2314/g.3352 Transcript_2314/m.3352 type:complete len:137 (+) Transcript_2314:68-478(+)